MLTKPTSEVKGTIGQQPGSGECEKASEKEKYSNGIGEWPNNLERLFQSRGPQPPVRGPVPVRGSVGAGSHKKLLISVGTLLFRRHAWDLEIRGPEFVLRGHCVSPSRSTSHVYRNPT